MKIVRQLNLIRANRGLLMQAVTLFLLLAALPIQGWSQSVWESMSNPDWTSVKVESLESSELPQETKEQILSKCKQELKQAKQFQTNVNGNAYEIKEVSKHSEILDRCNGQVGESFCQTNSIVEFVDKCAADVLKDAKLKKELAQ